MDDFLIGGETPALPTDASPGDASSMKVEATAEASEEEDGCVGAGVPGGRTGALVWMLCLVLVGLRLRAVGIAHLAQAELDSRSPTTWS